MVDDIIDKLSLRRKIKNAARLVGSVVWATMISTSLRTNVRTELNRVVRRECSGYQKAGLKPDLETVDGVPPCICLGIDYFCSKD